MPRYTTWHNIGAVPTGVSAPSSGWSTGRTIGRFDGKKHMRLVGGGRTLAVRSAGGPGCGRPLLCSMVGFVYLSVRLNLYPAAGHSDITATDSDTSGVVVIRVVTATTSNDAEPTNRPNTYHVRAMCR